MSIILLFQNFIIFRELTFSSAVYYSQNIGNILNPHIFPPSLGKFFINIFTIWHFSFFFNPLNSWKFIRSIFRFQSFSHQITNSHTKKPPKSLFDLSEFLEFLQNFTINLRKIYITEFWLFTVNFLKINR